MGRAIITFVNGMEITVKEKDDLIPLIGIKESKPGYMGILDPVTLETEQNNSIVRSVMDVLCTCDFFAFKDNLSVVFNVSAVLSVKNG